VPRRRQLPAAARTRWRQAAGGQAGLLDASGRRRRCWLRWACGGAWSSSVAAVPPFMVVIPWRRVQPLASLVAGRGRPPW